MPDLLQISRIILSYPLADCFEFRACFARRCLWCQNIWMNNLEIWRSGYFRKLVHFQVHEFSKFFSAESLWFQARKWFLVRIGWRSNIRKYRYISCYPNNDNWKRRSDWLCGTLFWSIWNFHFDQEKSTRKEYVQIYDCFKARGLVWNSWSSCR